MAESSLSFGLPELKKAVGFQLGYGRGTDVAWSASQLVEILELVQGGIRRVYFPPAVNADTVGYEWSWLRPTTTLELHAPYSTGTIGIVNGVVTMATGTVPSWLSAGDQLTVSNTYYSIASRDSDSQFTLTDLTVDVDAGTSYKIEAYIYDLPDDLGRVIGAFHYPVDEHRQSISIVSIGKLLQMRAASNLSGAPTHAAYRYKSSTGASGQRQEVLFFPTPDQLWTLSYEYEAFTGQLSDSYPYPLGGMKYSELYKESCLALAENQVEDAPGIHNQMFSALLVDAIARDRKHGAQNYGPMGQPETVDNREFRRGWGSGTYNITYNGTQISGA